MTKPSDLGYNDDGFILPPLTIHPHFVTVDYVPDGQLFFTKLSGISERAEVRRSTLDARLELLTSLINGRADEQWIIWCGLLPLLIVGPNGLREMFKDAHPRLGKPAGLGLLFLIGPAITPFFTLFLPRVMSITPTILLYSILFAITNGTFEEILWRGVYIKLFPDNKVWGVLWPSLWFGIWHLAPGSVSVVFSPWTLMAGAIVFGLSWSMLAMRTKTIRWSIISHTLTGLARVLS